MFLADNKTFSLDMISGLEEYAIIKAGDGFIVYNTSKHWDHGHSHISDFNLAISAIKLSVRKELPRNQSKYFIQSLVRLSNDKEYINRLLDLNINFKQLMEQSIDIDAGRCM